MSDIKTQVSASGELPGGEAPLTQPERRGNEQDTTFPLSGRRGTEVPLGATASRISPGKMNGVSPTPDSCTSNFGNVQSVPVSVRPVDRKTLEGSYAGDSRQKGTDAKMPQNPGPREGMTQAPLSGKQSPAPAPASFPGDLADSDAGV